MGVTVSRVIGGSDAGAWRCLLALTRGGGKGRGERTGRGHAALQCRCGRSARSCTDEPRAGQHRFLAGGRVHSGLAAWRARGPADADPRRETIVDETCPNELEETKMKLSIALSTLLITGVRGGGKASDTSRGDFRHHALAAMRP